MKLTNFRGGQPLDDVVESVGRHGGTIQDH
jgi:hypothetical protein